MTDSIPQNEVAEKGLLSSLIQKPRLVASESISSDLFFSPANLAIFNAISYLWMECDIPELQFEMVVAELKHRGELEEAGTIEYLNEVWAFVPSPEAWRWYYDSAKETATRRRAKIAASKIAGCEDLAKIKEYAAEISAAFKEDPAERKTTLRDSMMDAIEWIERRVEEPQKSAISFGIPDLDRALEPILPSEQVVICSETSGGKTSLAIQSVLRSENRSFAIFSLEMQSRSLAVRMLASESYVGLKELRTGRIAATDYPRITAAASRLSSRKVWIYDQHPITIASILAYCRSLQPLGLDAIVVDYIQLVSVPGAARGDGRERQVAEVSRLLKTLAMELNIVTIVLSQLNDDGKLRESRAIANDANVVLRIKHNAQDCEIVIEKNRDGATAEIPARFVGKYSRFEPV